jgi:hypothetical protein
MAQREVRKRLLDAVSATGAGSAAGFVNVSFTHTVQVSFTASGGSISALTVDLEGTTDGVNWQSLVNTTGGHVFTAAEITATDAQFFVVNRPVRDVRANITTLTDSGTGTVTVEYLGITG